MPRRKSLILFTVVIATVALLLAANQAGAFSPPNQQCPEGEMTAGECDVDGGYMVEIVPCCVGVNCQFPCYDGTETKFEYKITATGNQKIDNFDLLVATACPQDAAPPNRAFQSRRDALHGRGRLPQKVRKRALRTQCV